MAKSRPKGIVRIDFRSDNTAGASPEVVAAIAAAAEGRFGGYGNDPLTARVEKRLADIFERDVAIFPVATGTAANALALAACCPPHGAIYCEAESHVNVDECGAPEHFSGGAKLVALRGRDGRIDAGELAAALDRSGAGTVHHVQPAALSLSQATEAGTSYARAEIRALSKVARKHGLAVHMDGARFANALVHQRLSPAAMTWKAGVDVLSFGATKNGCLAAEAVVFFDRKRAEDFAFRRKRAGHLLSKMRLISAQLDAYLADDLWLRNARHANAMAQRLAAGLRAVPGVEIPTPVEANEVFPLVPAALADRLEKQGFGFYRWGSTVTPPDVTAPPAADGTARAMLRLVCAFATTPVEVDALLAAARQMAESPVTAPQ